ncbi:hypothetical protein SLEP1_g41064 [Rubroshorea leprosula]|uniref:RRM domain-containing protein n=1 Tax=Rubroshorea leprosula TaxID=152421 RepID=A0AAV5L6M8_9ROSI|nr:hypothetical protein SLEP1_g41064 [Rubroshorea leprosula]
MASSQHRCVFVGNIPYDATEEQLIEICREVGPVVSFRLVIDRETGKPKGYGFCEYKDEETALSARRNLQGYEINGRQLRVDFAENDKGSDRNREQGRGGVVVSTTVDPQKQLGSHGESVQQQPIGLHLAITAATVMAGALGGMQAGLQSNQNGLQSQSAAANDPLTLHLARMSRNQLNEIMSDIKKMATQNKEQARDLLLARPQLLKAIFQAQIMLGMVTPQVLQMPNIRQAPGQPMQPSLKDSHHGQQPSVEILPGLPPLAPKVLSGMMPKLPESQVSAVLQTSLAHNQFSAALQSSVNPRVQHSKLSSNCVLSPAALPTQSGVPILPSINPSLRPQVQATNLSSLNQQIQPKLAQNSGHLVAASLGHNSQALPNAAMQSSFIPHPSVSDAGFQPGTSRTSGLGEKSSRVHDSLEAINWPSKLAGLEDGRGSNFSIGTSGASNLPGPSHPFAVDPRPVTKVNRPEVLQQANDQISQPQLPPGMESVLLQQVLNLTPEQLSSLPPEQRQQVIQLQQALHKDQMQPS